MSTEVLTIRYGSKAPDEEGLPGLVLEFDDDIPAFLIENLAIAGFVGEPIKGLPCITVKPKCKMSASRMTHRLIATLVVWNELYHGYFRSEDTCRELRVLSPNSLASSGLCDPPSNAAKIRRIGRLRFDREHAISDQRFEDAQRIQAEHDKLVAELTGMTL